MPKTIVRHLAYLFYLGVLILPILVLDHEAALIRPFRDQLSSYIALIALNILLLEFFLSGRIRFLSTHLGLDWVLQTHQLFARVALAFLVIHPFIYSLPNHPNHSPGPATSEYLGMNGAGLISGIAALIALIAIVALALGREEAKMRYETWRFTHMLLAVIVSALGLYHVLVIGFYIQQQALQIYYLGLGFLAALSLVWTYILKPLTQSREAYAITKIENITSQQFLLTIKKLSGSLPKIQPGQYLWLKYGSSKPYPENPFSIALVNHEQKEMSLLIKVVGDFTAQLQQARIGERIYIDAAYGDFAQHALNSEKPIVMIAGGIGLAPFLSVLSKAKEIAFKNKIHFIYGNRLEDQIIDIAKLIQLADLKSLTIETIVSEPTAAYTGLCGMIDLNNIQTSLQKAQLNPKECLFFICGPSAMIDATEAALEKLAVPLAQIDAEKFQYNLAAHTPRTQATLARCLIGTLLIIAVSVWRSLS